LSLTEKVRISTINFGRGRENAFEGNKLYWGPAYWESSLPELIKLERGKAYAYVQICRRQSYHKRMMLKPAGWLKRSSIRLETRPTYCVRLESWATSYDHLSNTTREYARCHADEIIFRREYIYGIKDCVTVRQNICELHRREMLRRTWIVCINTIIVIFAAAIVASKQARFEPCSTFKAEAIWTPALNKCIYNEHIEGTVLYKKKQLRQ
jgi:hypothetical protein